MHTHAFQAADGKIHCHRVEHLWAATARSPTIQFDTEDMVRNINEHINKFDCEDWQRVEEADLSYSIIYSDDHGIVDGWHRVAKAMMLGHETIAGRYLPAYPKPYAIYNSWAEYEADT